MIGIDLVKLFVPFAKIMILILQGIYVLFAFMLTRQLKIMNLNFKTNMAPAFSFLAFIHLVAAFVILVLTFLAR